MGLGMCGVTVLTRWPLLGATPELVPEVKSDREEVENGSALARDGTLLSSFKLTVQ